MAKKLNVPSVTGLNVDGLPFGIIVFLQNVENALNTIDENVVYKDAVTLNVQSPKIRAITSQGQGFVVSNTNLASGEDFGKLVTDVRSILEDLNGLRVELNTLKNQIKGS